MLYAWISLGVLLLCLIALPVSLIALLFRGARRTAKWVALASTVGMVASFVSFGYQHDMLTGNSRIFGKPVAGPRSEAAPQPEISPAVQRDIDRRKITLGMTPQEAGLAAGVGGFYKVQADPSRWPPGSDPLLVINRQSTQPDDSQITLTFRNKTQFDTPEPVVFRVEIRKGRVAEIAAVNAPQI